MLQFVFQLQTHSRSIVSLVWSELSYRFSLYRLHTDGIENNSSDVLLRRNVYRSVVQQRVITMYFTTAARTHCCENVYGAVT
jgi:hypothetical protein